MLGDFNARVGKPEMINTKGEEYEYIDIKDDTQNAPGRSLLNMCKEKSLVVTNHLKHRNRVFGGNLSFKKGNKWVSEIDLCLVHEKMLPALAKVEVRQDFIRSDHAPICVSLNTTAAEFLGPILLEGAQNLGKSYVRPSTKNDKLLRTQTCRETNVDNFKDYMSAHPPPVLTGDNIESAISTSFQTMRNGAKDSKQQTNINENNTWETSHPRWKRLMDSDDPRSIWKAINWKGDVEEDTMKPDDSQFKLHFENLLKVNTEQNTDVQVNDSPYIPVLDDAFTLQEVTKAIKEQKVGKSYTGICPGLLANLPGIWLMFLLILFNLIFHSFSYPAQWAHSRLITLFKSGNRMVCGNYRGISIMDTLAKVFDKLLLNRLILWSAIDKCQAGAQKGRGCIEQIMTLRLLIDLAKKEKRKLYVLFIDFSKAYDKVPRNKMIEHMKSMGCGRIMLLALKNMYRNTVNVLNTIKIDTSSGVRQGAPTSCLLFIMYVDKMVRMIKEAVPVDGFLGTLHVLMLMDDTVIVATNRETCRRKVDAVLDYCGEYGMELNIKKTKFFVVNPQANDKAPLCTKGKIVDYCEKYLYLGSWFTDDGKIESALKLHEPAHQDTLNKFSIFCHVNTEMPFYCKSLVMDAAATSSIFYGCETWLNNNPRHVIATYNRLIKYLLGVRKNTSIDLCLVESGKQPAKYMINKRLKTFLEKKMSNRDMDEPFQMAFEMCKNSSTPGYKFLKKVIDGGNDNNSLEKIVQVIRSKDNATKFVTYRTELNPNLSTHDIYTKSVYIPDYKRIAFTRLRLMSHNLKVETGRWSRIVRDRRVCLCDRSSLQDEKHALIACTLSTHLRQRYAMLPFNCMNNLLGNEDIANLCNYIHDVLKVYN